LAAPSGDRQNEPRESDRRQNLLVAERALQRTRFTIEQMLKIAPGDAAQQVELANLQVRIAAIRQFLHEPGDAMTLTRSGLAVLRSAAGKDKVSPMILDLVVTAFLRAEPASLRDPQFATACSERGVTLTHRKTPAWLLSLSEAYRETGQIEKGHAAATEGLALLPAAQAGTPKSRIRKLLEREARSGARESEGK
jgi:hypothetical protein